MTRSRRVPAAGPRGRRLAFFSWLLVASGCLNPRPEELPSTVDVTEPPETPSPGTGSGSPNVGAAGATSVPIGEAEPDSPGRPSTADPADAGETLDGGAPNEAASDAGSSAGADGARPPSTRE